MNLNWPSLTIDEACDRLIDYRGKTPRKVNHGIRLVTAKVVKGGRIINAQTEYITDGEYEKWMTRGIPKKGDVLLTTEAPLGEVAILRTDEKIALAQRIILLRAKPNVLDSNYLLYALQTPLMQGRLYARTSGTTVIGIKNRELRKVKIPTPPIHIQERISLTLAAYDDLIENNKRRIALLEESARQLYKEWFVRFRFPGHEHVKVVDGVPEGWDRRKLRDLLVLNYGKALKADNRVTGKYPVFGSSGIIGSHHKSLVKGPGIIIGRKGNVGSVYWSYKDFFPIDTVYYISSDESSHFIYYALLHTTFINTDVAVPGLNRDFAYTREILTPPTVLRQEFENEVIPIFKQCHILSKYNDKLTEARDLLLPKLMNGEIAV